MEIKHSRKRERYFEYRGRSLPINADEDYLCIEPLLEVMADQFFAALDKHSRLVVARFDVTSYEDVESNESVGELIRRVKQWLRRTYRMRNVGHFWVREHSRDKGVHWHVLLFLDGNKVRTNFMLNDYVKNWWETRDLGLFSYPAQKSYHAVNRQEGETLNDCFYHASYLTKERSKGYVGHGCCSYGASKMRER